MILMLRMFMIIVCLWGVLCCSTLALNRDSTPAERKAAICKDAAMGYALSVSCLEGSVKDSDHAKYWTAYKLGVESAMVAYCGKCSDDFLDSSGVALK